MDVISLGAGVQSTTMLLMACHGEIMPKPQYAIFSDTGWEPKSVYEHLEWLKGEAARYGIEVIVTSNGNIREDILASVNDSKRVASLPFFTKDKDGNMGMVRRQCTNEYKIQPVQKMIRQLLGYQSRQRIKEHVNLWLGISLDEVQRMKPSRETWITHLYPLIDRRMSRMDCLNWMEKQGYPLPPKSSCIGCPFHTDRMWLDIKRNDPEAWKDAVYIDKVIKNLPRFKGEAYLHRSGRPLDQVYLQEDQIEIDFFNNECEGMCGV